MKKTLMGAVVLMIFSISIVVFQLSCKKDAKGQTNNASIQGLWIGTYTVSSQPQLGQQYFSLIIKPDGTMIADTKALSTQHLAPGTWTLSGNQLSCTYTCVYGLPVNVGVTETATATWDKSGNLTGTWVNDPSTGNSGVITLTKVE